MNDQNPENQGDQNLSDVLAEQDQESPQSQAEPADEAHKCSICGGPDHRACGCEAKAEKEKQAAPPNEKISQALSEAGNQPQTIVDILTSIDSGVHDLIELEKQRRDLLKDIQNGPPN